MSVDVMRNPPFAAVELRWYKHGTTPFALCGHIGPVLLLVPWAKYGHPWVEGWFGDDGFQLADGSPIGDDEVLAWALPAPPYQPVLDQLYELLKDLFDCDSAMGAWLDNAQPTLDGATPRELIERGDGERVLAAVRAAGDGNHL
jgi:hypothetical protein